MFTPLQMTRYTLTDGVHTVVFKTIIHIYYSSFYKIVEADAKDHVDAGYTFLYEGIRVTQKEVDENKTSVPDYTFISKAFGLTGQGNGDYFKIVNQLGGLDADVDNTWLNEDLKMHGIDTKEDLKIAPKDIEQLKAIMENYHKIIEIVGPPLVRFGSRIGLLLERVNDYRGTHSATMQVILVDRNTVLLRCIKNTKNDKIYINYGGAHFANLFEQMKADNSAWHIIETKNFKAF
jgi:hypothetical protein